MALYFLLGTLNATGQEMIHSDGDLIITATRDLKIKGAELLGQYAVLGRYDFIMMVEADNNDAVARCSLEIGVRTGLHIETLPAIAIGYLTDRTPDEPVDRPTSVQRTPEE